MKKRFLDLLKNHIYGIALNFTSRWSECRIAMVQSVDNNGGMIEYGLLGILTALTMIHAVLGGFFKIALFASVIFVIIFILLIWVCCLMEHPVWTTITTAALTLPFLFGCIYCNRIKRQKMAKCLD